MRKVGTRGVCIQIICSLDMCLILEFLVPGFCSLRSTGVLSWLHPVGNCVLFVMPGTCSWLHVLALVRGCCCPSSMASGVYQGICFRPPLLSVMGFCKAPPLLHAVVQ